MTKDHRVEGPPHSLRSFSHSPDIKALAGSLCSEASLHGPMDDPWLCLHMVAGLGVLTSSPYKVTSHIDEGPPE